MFLVPSSAFPKNFIFCGNDILTKKNCVFCSNKILETKKVEPKALILLTIQKFYLKKSLCIDIIINFSQIIYF